MRTDKDNQRMVLVMNACCILHNLCVRTWQDFITPDEALQARREAYSYQPSQPPRSLGPITPGKQRREEILREMIDLDKDGFREFMSDAARCKSAV